MRVSRGGLIIAGVILAGGTVGYYTQFAPVVPLSLAYRLLTDGIILLLWLSAAALSGWWVLRMFHVEQAATGLRIITAAALGLGIISLATLGLGLAGWLNQGSAIGLLAICAAPGVALLLKTKPRISSPTLCHRATLSPCPLVIPLIVTALIGGLVYPGFLWGADDPSGYDVVEYHLQVPREWYELGKIVPLKHNVFSFFPFNVEMHYLLAMNLRGGPWEGMYLAQWMHLAYLALAVAGIAAAVRPGRPRVLAILAAGSCAWLTMLGAVAYNEGGLLLYGTLAVAWVLRGVEGEAGAARSFALAGVMAGLAGGCKLTGVPMLVVALPVAVVVAGLRLGGRRAAQIGAFVLAAIITLSPWLIRNQVWAGNPVFPEAMGWLGQAHFTNAQVERWDAAHRPRADQRSVAGRLGAAWLQIAADWRYGYVLPPLALAAAVLAIRQRETRLLLALLAAMALFWLFGTHLQSRFFVMGIPIMAMLVAGMDRRIVFGCAVGVLAAAVLLAIYGTAVRLSEPVRLIETDPASVMDRAIEISALRDVTLPLRPDQSIQLIGEARAFWFNLPSSRLYYRTVFDVPGDERQAIDKAWVQGWPVEPDMVRLENISELDRLARTYRRLRPVISRPAPVETDQERSHAR